jgi:hypothetical protein
MFSLAGGDYFADQVRLKIMWLQPFGDTKYSHCVRPVVSFNDCILFFIGSKFARPLADINSMPFPLEKGSVSGAAF